jgi:hypothetical protein
MDSCRWSWRSCRQFCLILVPALLVAGEAIAGDRYRSVPGRVIVRRARPIYVAPAGSTLGTFAPTPYIMVRGNYPVGGGYSPLEVFGDQSMSLYGPFSPLRSTSAPVQTYTRGYDGAYYPGEATSFSNPNLPGLSPVIYPTPGNYYYAPRENRTPPWWFQGTHWIDQQ